MPGTRRGPAPSAGRRAAARKSGLLFGLPLVMGLGALAPASAQEIVQRFINPSFGGNPFYSDHLLGVATAQRPERDRGDARELTETEQFARQLQSRLLSALSSSLVQSITGAAPGTSGEFTVGDQTIFFERTLAEIRLRITNTVTGEVTEIVVPVLNFARPGGAPNGAPAGATASSPSTLSTASGPLVTSAGSLGASGPLTPSPLEPANVTSGGLQF